MELPIPFELVREDIYEGAQSETDEDEDEQAETRTGQATKWKFIKAPTAELNVDDTDAFLLAKARQETTRLVQRLMHRFFGTLGGHPSQVSTLDVLRLWMDRNFLNIAQQHINASLDARQFISVSELLEFVEVELWLSVYGVSPSVFYHITNKRLYPPSKRVMKSKRYFAVLNALGTQCGRIATSEEFWNAPFEPDRNLANAMDTLRRVCSEIGFVNEVSIASLDDDLLRLRSRSVEDVGLTRIRNPKKGFGPVHHGVVSLVTGLYLSGHIASRGESLGEVLKLMMRSLCGVSTDSQIDLPGVLFALDRGYQSKAVNQHIVECGGSVIGTHKRTQNFPFTYGNTARQSQKLINEVGAMSTSWASYKCVGRSGSSSASGSMYALAFRSGLKSVVLCSTSDKEAGPGKWTYVPCARSEQQISEDDFADFETRVKPLTERQRTPDWFLMRQFRVTGLVSITILRAIADLLPQSRDDIDDHLTAIYGLADMTAVQLVLRVLDIRVAAASTEGPSTRDDGVGGHLTSDDLENKKGSELKQMCQERGLPAYGTIAAMKDRLLGQSSSTPGSSTTKKPKSLAATLLSAWFLAPTSNTDMKIGTKNEENISSRVAGFVAKHSDVRIVATKSYGLLSKPDQSYLACSPDDISVMTVNAQTLYAVMEYKTGTRSSTVAKEKEIVAQHGPFTTIHLDTGHDGVQFRMLVPDQGHRSQIMHNIIVSSLRNGFLVYASKTSILRVVHVIVSDDVADAYLLALSSFKDKCLNWIYASDEPIPKFTTEELGHCGDMDTLEQHLSLWRSLTSIVEARRRPLPAAHQIIPTVIAKWNRVKGGIDVYSRYLKNVKARHAHLAPLAAIWIRMMMTLVYNAFQTAQLLENYSFLMDEERCKSYSAYQNQKCRNSTLLSFCREAAEALPELYDGKTDSDAGIDVADAVADNDDVMDEAAKVLSIAGRSFSYHKRKHFEVDAEWRRIRLSNRKDHRTTLLPGTKQLSCLVCCRIRNHDKENLPKNAAHTRHGNKTRNECNVCKVPLCNIKRWDGRSCFDVFHADTKLPDPCKQTPETRAAHIRPPPPSRKRPHNSIEPTERQVTRLTPQPRRRSGRLAAIK